MVVCILISSVTETGLISLLLSSICFYFFVIVDDCIYAKAGNAKYHNLLGRREKGQLGLAFFMIPQLRSAM